MGKKGKILIVNAITALRIVGTFLLPLIILTSGPIGSAIYLAALWASDFIDGPLARHWKVSTLFGSLFDAGSDKILSFASLAYLISINPLFIISTLIELGILSANVIGGVKGVDVKSSYIGKGKTFIFGLTAISSILSTILTSGFVPYLANALIPISIVAEGMTLIDYITKIETQDRKKKSNKFNIRKFFKDLKEPKELKEALFSPEFFIENKDKSLKEKVSKETVQHENTKSNNAENNIETMEETREAFENDFSIETKNYLKTRYLLNDDQILALEESYKNSKLSKEEFLSKLELFLHQKETRETISSYTNDNKPKTRNYFKKA